MLRRVLFAILLIVGLAQAALAERRVALVLAAGDYKELRPLTNPVNDARAMEDLLKSLDFEVYLETNRDLKRMRRALDDFREDAKGADVALVFFAGHGVALNGLNYLLPTDADASSSARLAETSLPLADVQAVLAEVAPVSIVLLDACRDDPFAGGGGAEGERSAVALADDPPEAAKAQPGLGRIGRSDGVLFAFSAAPGETASDGDSTNSPFTAALLRHFGTAGVELKSALTLVQQDVYDRSRGKQLPYIESGLPELVFIKSEGTLPERDQLLMAMAGLTEDLRVEVETVAAANNMPLAPLYAALISGDLTKQTPEERERQLQEAANSYAQFQSELVKYSSDDPKVADLRSKAEEQLTLGAFDAARALLTEAAEIDATARVSIKNNFLSRTLSEASTHVLNANAARTDLRYDLAISDLTRATELYSEVEEDLPDRDTKFAYAVALQDLGDLQMVAGNTFGALGAQMTRSEFAQGQAKADPTDLGWTREVIWSLNAVGTVLQQQGYLQEAEEAFSSAFDMTQAQSDRMPDDPDLMRDREVLRNKLGEVRYALNDFPGALAAYEEALTIADALMAWDSESVTYKRDVSYCQERIGDVYVAMGDTAKARDAFDVSFRIADDLVKAFPNDQEMRRDLSVSYERLGDMMIAEKDYDSALASYNEALKIREDLAALDPANVLRQRDSSVTYERIGDIYNLMGDTGSALMSHEAARDIRQRLVALDPSNTTWARDLSVSHERVGELHYQEGDYPGALEAYELSRDLRLEIVAVDPSNLPRQRDLGVSYEKLGVTYWAMGDLVNALAQHQEALVVRRQMVATDPTISQYRRDVSYSLINIGDIDQANGDLEAAHAAFAETVSLREALVAEGIGGIADQRDLSVAQNRLVDVLLSLNRPAEAVPVAQASLAVADAVLALNKDDVGSHIDRLVSANRLGDALVAAEDNDGALAAFKIMAEEGYYVSSANPYDVASASDYALALSRLGAAYHRLGNYSAARTELETAVALRQWLTGQNPNDLVAQRDLGYALQNLGDTYFAEANYAAGKPFEEQALRIMRRIKETDPSNVWNVIDLVTALDRTASYYDDRTALFTEALALLEGLQANGQLPEGYDGWIANYRKALGQP